MKSFLSDCRPATSSAESEAFVISWRYGMGDPLAPSKARGTGRGEAWNRRKGFMAIQCSIFQNKLLLSMRTHLPEEP
jgi:hypothetical protein